jgi:hypothetical protein
MNAIQQQALAESALGRVLRIRDELHSGILKYSFGSLRVIREWLASGYDFVSRHTPLFIIWVAPRT